MHPTGLINNFLFGPGHEAITPRDYLSHRPKETQMHPTISDAFSRARVAELRARADAHRLGSRPERRFSFRYAEPRDRPALERLAVLDGAGPIATPLLVAEIDDAVVAAIGAG